MKRLAGSFLISFVAGTLLAQQSEKDVLDFSLLRQNDVITMNEASRGFYPGLKSIDLSESTLSFGGSYRGQYEYFRNENFQPMDGEDGWYLQRTLLHGHFKSKKGLEIFAELGYSDVFGKPNESPVDVNELYLNQGFISYTKNNWKISLGRENIRLGSGRLVDVREGPNVRRSFDGVNAIYGTKDYTIRSFYVIPVGPKPGVFDDDYLHEGESLWGVYFSRSKGEKNISYDLYYLGVNYEANEYTRGVDTETRHSMGVRINRKSDGFNFDNEAVYQFGKFGEEGISAWTISFNLWQKVNPFTLGFKTELISGDDGDGNLGTFNAMYPRGAYFGRVAKFGPANLIDFHPYIQYRKGKFFAEVDYDHFWRFSARDGVYDPPLNVLFDGTTGRNIAGQIGTITNYEFSRHLVLELETNYILVRDVIEAQVNDAKNLLHIVFTGELRF